MTGVSVSFLYRQRPGIPRGSQALTHRLDSTILPRKSRERCRMGSYAPKRVRDYVPETHPRQVLLCNPPVYDTRFPWSRFQQPITLLQLSTRLKRCGCDVRLLDALHTKPGTPQRRRRMRVLMRDDISLNWWRFGRLPSELASQLIACKREGWIPEEVYILGPTTFWWEGVAESAALVRHHFPHARVILAGAYPTLAPDHAAEQCGADIMVVGQIEGLAGLPLDLSLYDGLPTFAFLSIGTDQRSTADLIEELLDLVTPFQKPERVWQLAFADHDVARRFPHHFRAVLETCIERACKVSFFALGNLYPRDLVADPELASLLVRAGFKQLVFADDRDLPLSEEAREVLYDEYQHAIERCVAAGYPRRTEALVASVCLGRPGEDPGEVVAFMTRLVHVAGSLMVLPYQPVPSECPPTLPLELQNGRLFPFAQDNGLHFRGYQDILGIAALLNSKHRSRTFDFSGDGLIARLVRESLLTQSWQPPVEQGNQRPVPVGWFNKEGKWVRS
jgi:hypothetical protein